LYSEKQSSWDEAAQLMFEISSEANNSSKALRVLARAKKWKLSTTGTSKLFI
jgi:hypothetical protein